ncbi:MAG TPA: terminase small subunit [Candidatus Butyricicoccus avistercoris]|uniref:Terminase small subunit n=1 Tax=Candidatus Butyricicoccus avistercoris TaxID=2838518 RepID=A0A9D1PGI5_9FIRM|nr:terminase small subunit [Candidatus Butyricicoccus avistercoris]
MTDKQKKFCDEYLIDCNGRRAYKAAYPNVKKDAVADVNASRLLSNTKVKKYIDEQLSKIHSNKIADAQEVMEYLTSVIRGESSSSVLAFCGDGRQKVIKKHPDEKERMKAAELIGKRYGLFTYKVEMGGAVPVIIVGDDQLEE